MSGCLVLVHGVMFLVPLFILYHHECVLFIMNHPNFKNHHFIAIIERPYIKLNKEILNYGVLAYTLF